jgi:hypothetical protein
VQGGWLMLEFGLAAGAGAGGGEAFGVIPTPLR